MAAVSSSAVTNVGLPVKDRSFIVGGPNPQNIPMSGVSLVDGDQIEAATNKWFLRTHLVSRPTSQFSLCLSQFDWVGKRKVGGKWVSLDENHPLQRLLHSPTWSVSVAEVGQHLPLCGNGVWRKYESSGRREPGASRNRLLDARGIRVVIPRLVDIEGDAEDPTYVFDDGDQFMRSVTRRVKIKRSEMVHMRLFHPTRQSWGVGVIGGIEEQLVADMSAVRWNRASFDSRGIHDGVFETDLDPDGQTYQALKEQIIAQRKNPHEELLLMGGLKYKPLSKSAIEMDYTKGRVQLREDALSGQSMPPVMAGYYDQATLANAKVARQIWWEDTMIPQAELLAEQMTQDIVPHFGAVGEIRIEADANNIPAVREALESKVKTLFTGRSSGVPYKEMVTMLNLPFSGEQEAPPAALLTQAQVALAAEQQQEQTMRGEGPLSSSVPGAAGA